MNILFVVPDASLGGHTRTATTIAQALRARGHGIHFVVGPHCDCRVIEAAEFALTRTQTDWLGRFAQLQADLVRLIRAQGVEVVHTFSIHGMVEIVRACQKTGARFWYTKCGGTTPPRLLPVRPMISLSEEVKAELVARGPWRDEDIHVIPARINVRHSDAVLRNVDLARHTAFKAKYGVPDDARVLLRIARMDSVYLNSVLHGIETAARLHEKGMKICFVHIGFFRPEVGKWVYETILRAVDAANARCGARVAVSAQDEALEATQYLSMADVVIGAGRSAFEAMVLEKPTLVVGMEGYAGLVAPDTIDALAYYNFSGRNVVQPVPFDASVTAMTNAVAALLDDPATARHVGLFGREYVVRTLDVEAAAGEYEKLYTASSKAPLPDEATLRTFTPPLLDVLKRRFISLSVRTYVHRVLRRLRRGNTRSLEQ